MLPFLSYLLLCNNVCICCLVNFMEINMFKLRKRRGIVIVLASSAAAASSAAGRAKTLTFSYISVITEDIYLKLRVVVHYQKGNPYQ